MSPLVISHRVARFLRRAEGGVLVEAVLILPALLGILLSTFIFHDLFNYRNVRQKATFTVADMISRETEPLTATYLDNAMTLFNTIAHGETDNTLRVTVIGFESDTGTYEVDWSEVRGVGNLRPLTTLDVASAHDGLPTMTDEERLIVVDSAATFRPIFDVGMGEMEITARAFLRPRFSPQVIFDGT